ncbi:hypothetical protein [Thalassobellus citreus]|uniref:hypothetical protein n=1 Tax=Thalassobellus citreus TaxID=3367752 RepID=UPI0037ACFBDD
MKYYILLITTLFIFSCGKGKTVQLPEINHSEISEINDVSAAYLFYDETQKDSVELNRKNLISTTNWLVNVDKRLTLKQAIPHIKFIQEKKNNSNHKNENSKNYFTCNDTSKKNLGFIEFTDVVFNEESSSKNTSKISQLNFDKKLNLEIHSSNVITLIPITNNSELIQSNILNLNENIFNAVKNIEEEVEIILELNKSLLFQEYISIKSTLSELNIKNVTISNNEFISNY